MSWDTTELSVRREYGSGGIAVLNQPVRFAVALAVGLGASPVATIAADIHTGGASGAYHTTFCPLLKSRLATFGATYDCKTSFGSSENLRRIARDPTDFGFAQLDVFALESGRFGGQKTFRTVRTDDVRECVFAVTADKNLTNYGQIAVNADVLKFVLPPRSSGSASTFEFLSSIDPTGLGRARRVSHAADTDEAIRRTLQDGQAVTFFVQFPDPANERFQLIRRLGGHLVPVIDGVILDQTIDDKPVYFAQETLISQQPWLRAGSRVVTACTPLVLFTGNPNRIREPTARAAHRQLIASVRALRSGDLVPRDSVFERLYEQTRSASSRAREHFLLVARNARLRARPFIERMWRVARDGVRTMIEKAQPQE
jgi:hypothetical protein